VNTKRKPFGDPIIHDRNGKPIHAKTHGQYELTQAIDKYDILFVNGPAGTGKTFLSVCKAVKAIDDKKFKKLILTRPAVESGEELGALPGDINDKISPYMKPLYQCIEKLKAKKPPVLRNNNTKTGMKKKARKKTAIKTVTNTDTQFVESWYKKIEVSPLAYMRGLTFEDAFILMDEAQNVSETQMKLFLTRMGVGSKAIITGDASQSDLNRSTRSGFKHAQTLLTGVEGIGFVTLTENDIVRHKLVKDIILRYEQKDSFRTRVYSNQD